jgi:hypothetical protein
MNTVNMPTGFLPFMLKTERAPKLILPIVLAEVAVDWSNEYTEGVQAEALIKSIDEQVMEAQDCMLAAKISQVHHTNRDHEVEKPLGVGDKVLLATVHWWREYMQKRDGRCTKFMPRFDGPYEIIEAYPDSSMYKLKMPPSSHVHPTFHSSQLCPFLENVNELFVEQKLTPPSSIVTADGSTEYFIEQILDLWPHGWGWQYLVWWQGYGPEHDLWLPRSELLEMEALASWEAKES